MGFLRYFDGVMKDVGVARVQYTNDPAFLTSSADLETMKIIKAHLQSEVNRKEQQQTEENAR